MNLPVEVIDAARDGKALLFVGSAATREAADLAGFSIPDGAALARTLGWRPPKLMPGTRNKPVNPSVSAGAAVLEASKGRPALLSALREAVGAENIAPSPAYELALQRFPLIFTTCFDTLIERAADADLVVARWGDPVPDAGLYRLRGDLDAPVLTEADRAARSTPTSLRDQIRGLIRKNLVFFIGYRPDEEEFEQLWEDLTLCYGAELPRCHLAVASGQISDYQWQRWVWRGLLLFSADPTECLQELESSL